MPRTRFLTALGLAPQPDGSKYPTWMNSKLVAAVAALLVVGQIIAVIDGLHGVWAWLNFVVLWLLIVVLAASVRDLRRQGR